MTKTKNNTKIKTTKTGASFILFNLTISSDGIVLTVCGTNNFVLFDLALLRKPDWVFGCRMLNLRVI